MKIIKLLPPLFLIFTCFCFAQCKKHIHTPTPDNPYGLPNATQTGAGVFACRINRVNVIAKHDIMHQGGGVHGDTLGVEGSALIGHFFNVISLGLFGNIKINTPYDLKDTIHTFCWFATDSTCSMVGSVSNFYPRIGTFTITKLDTTHPFTSENIISGTFNFKVPIPGCDTLNVTDGRFDIRY